MTRSKSNSFRPNCESLEAREVPAIVLAGTFANNTVTPTGGAVAVTEVATVNGTFFFDQNGANVVVGQNIDGQANDTLTFALNGDALTITNSTDKIFVMDQFGFLNNFNGSTTIQGVTGLNVNLNQGGNDSITDNTTLGSTINGGIGNDTITVAGGAVNPLLLQLLMQPGGLNPALLPLLSQMSGPAKNISGGDGDDTITVNGFASMFMIDGGVGADRINGPTFGLFNQLKGGADNDIIIGGMGQDIIFGDAGVDILFGFGGNDFLISVDGGPDFVLNQPGDTVIPDPGLDVLSLKI